MSGSEWAVRHRIISGKAAKPGPYRLGVTPYAKGIMDAATDDYITDLAFMKPVQCGGTTIGENSVGAWIDLDPGPIMMVFATEDTVKKRIREDMLPMIRDTPRLAAHLTGRPRDLKIGSVKLRSCTMHTGWAGSPASLASVPIRYLILDEVDKYPAWRGKEADPISLGKMRTKTFEHRAKRYLLSTPTIPDGPIARAVKESGDVRDWCPVCPHCEAYIRPDWDQVHWEGMDTSEEDEILKTRVRLETGDVVAYYTCQHCEKDIDSDAFWLASKRGGWVSVGATEPGKHPKSRSVAFRLSGLCTTWTRLQGAATEFTAARIGGLSKMQNFYNSILGLPFWGEDGNVDPTLTVTPEKVWHLVNQAEVPEKLPDWATCVVAGVDSGKADHPYVVRAFGKGFQSALLEYGVARGAGREEFLLDLLEKTYHGPGGRALKIRRMLVDSGGGRGTRNQTRTEEVYRFVNKDPARIWAIKGYSGERPLSSPIQTRMINYRPPGDRYMNTLDVRLSTLDVNYWKDLVATYINTDLWLPHSECGRDYVMQLCAEQKKLVRHIVKPDGTSLEDWRWVTRASGLANHFWDCEVYAVAAAHMVGADEIITEAVVAEGEDIEDGGWAPPSYYTRGGSWI